MNLRDGDRSYEGEAGAHPWQTRLPRSSTILVTTVASPHTAQGRVSTMDASGGGSASTLRTS